MNQCWYVFCPQTFFENTRLTSLLWNSFVYIPYWNSLQGCFRFVKTYCLCGIWAHGLTTCPLYVSPFPSSFPHFDQQNEIGIFPMVDIESSLKIFMTIWVDCMINFLNMFLKILEWKLGFCLKIWFKSWQLCRHCDVDTAVFSLTNYYWPYIFKLLLHPHLLFFVIE